MLQVNPMSGAIGAEVSGIDLSEELTDIEFSELESLFLQYEVLFFRDQPIPPEAHARFARRFGEPQCHEAYPHISGFPELTILENDKEHPSKIEMWHTDMTFRPCPPVGSILHGVVIPERGGDTLFASMSAAYDNLSETLQSFLSGLTAIHDFSHGFRESLDEPGGRERLGQMLSDNPPVEHPVIRTHPVTGKKGVFVNSLFTVEICGMKTKESDALLQFLYDHAVLPEHTCRFSWQPNSIAFWDNRITQHKPVNDYWPQRRKMQRITIDDGIRPV